MTKTMMMNLFIQDIIGSEWPHHPIIDERGAYLAGHASEVGLYFPVRRIYQF